MAILAMGFILGVLSAPINMAKFFIKPKSQDLYVVSEHKPFVIIVPSYNNSEWVEKNLSSIFAQKYDNYRVIYIDDASVDATGIHVEDYVAQCKMAHRIEVIHNLSNRGACENIYRAIHSCGDEEIALVLDGDDWLAYDRVLERLNEIYANPDTWLTYGSYIEYPSYSYTVANFSRPLPEAVLKKNSIREYSKKHYCFSHLKTFQVSLFKKIKLEDFLENGKFFDAASDASFMIPMVEMAGFHAKYVREVFYIYNRATPLNDNKVRGQRQLQLTQYICGQPCYSRLD